MRLSVSVKMILTTTLLIVVTVVGSGVLTVINIRRVFDETTARLVAEFEKGREVLGGAQTPLFGQALLPLVTDNRTAEIKILLENAIVQDTKKDAKDYGLRLAFVLDLSQLLMVHCFEGEQLACVEGVLPRAGIDQVKHKLSTQAWQTALAEWKKEAAAPRGGEALVRFNLAGDDGARYRMFAYPLFTTTPPT